MHHELVCYQKHWPKLPYTNTREVHLKVCFIINGCALIRVNKIGSTTVYLTWVLEENGLCIERFHRGCFLIGMQSEKITFCSKDAFNTVERQLIQNAVLCHGGQ